jgi:membrane protein involved in D-alanine export
MDLILHQTLPFTSPLFFGFIALVFTLFFICKKTLSKILPYKYLLALVSLVYLALLFPKPLQFIGLTIYLYFCVLGLKKWYKSNKLGFPMLLMALPMIIMKWLNVTHSEDTDTDLNLAKTIFQIAGISYLVFKVIGLYIDERKSKTPISFLDFFNFSAFVPTLLIGPIDRFKRFQSDVKVGYDNITTSMVLKGWQNFILGLLYKFIIAEAIRRLVLVNLVNDGSLFYHFSYMYTYLLYLYFDFAGYSLLAIAFGNFIGIDVPINFHKPFLAVNPKEFWKRWHKSLGDWLNDYFFKPIFKHLTQKKILTSIKRQNIALFLTFSLMGFWNGFQIHFIASGMLFGLYSMVHNYYAYQCKKQKRDVFFGNLSPKIIRILSIIIMFNLVAFAIYIFSGELI